MDLILNNYKVVFSSPLNWGFPNQMDSINDWLSLFLIDHQMVKSANALIAYIAKAQDDPSLSLFTATQGLQAVVINSIQTKIYEDAETYINNNAIAPAFVLPTADFKIIAIAWRDYIAKSPTTPQYDI